MTDHAVLIAGAGPTGLMLAGELALGGVDVAIVERRADQTLVGSRAGGLMARTLEILDQRGLVGRFLAEGQKAQVTGFAMARLDISDFPTRHPYGLALWQNHIERLLAEWVAELGVPILRGREVTGFAEDDAGVTVALSDGPGLRAQYLVGCDGGRSLVRRAAGIGFPGWDASVSTLLAEVEMTEEPPLGIHRTALGQHAFGREGYEIIDGQIVYATSGPVRVMLTEADPGATGTPTLNDLRAGLMAACGTDYGAHSPVWISRFKDTTRQAERYRKGRVLLAGDAAHVHSPVGGQGLNTGVQDAVNLGWKLALVARGLAPDSLLDTYHAERHPLVARVLRLTMAQVALLRPDDRSAALREVMADLLGLDAVRQRLAGTLSGLDVTYDLGEGHPLLGRRMPDLDLVVEGAQVRLAEMLHRARPLLLRFGVPGLDMTGWTDRVDDMADTAAGSCAVPGIGPVPLPGAVLIRPDGHVAWSGEGGQAGLAAALQRWFGPPGT